MTNPLPRDNRPFVGWRTSEVIEVPAGLLYEYPPNHPNPHDALAEDTICNICNGGNVKLVDALKMGDSTLADAPEIGRAYLWDFPTLKRNHKCSMCRLVWRTFSPFYEKLIETKVPDAILGRKRGGGHSGPKCIKLFAMTYKDTMDNQDMRGSGSVLIYEDERIPTFFITEPASDKHFTSNQAPRDNWRQSRILKNDEIDFNLVKRWMRMCSTEHGNKCGTHNSGHSPAMRLIDVNNGCVVDAVAVDEYLALSYIWGTTPQFKLTKLIKEDASHKNFLESLGTKIPLTIRDAMQVCREIGVHRLWVDALCIVQDDEEEKKIQINQMDVIYGCALAVLIVAAGEDANNGIPGLNGKNRDLICYAESVGDGCLMTSLAATTLSARRSAWNTRAWTYQEYTLGKRLLVFSDTYVFFKCSSGIYRDDAVIPTTGPIPSTPMENDDMWIISILESASEASNSRAAWERGYKTSLAIYLRRHLTFDSDALPAFSGVIKVLSRSLGEFHFGLPKAHFSRSLLWDSGQRSGLKRRPEYPSWSWAGWKWVFNYFNAERNVDGAYSKGWPKLAMPMHFFLVKDDGMLEHFFLEQPEVSVDGNHAGVDQPATNSLSTEHTISGYDLEREQIKKKAKKPNRIHLGLNQPGPAQENLAIETGCILRLICQLVPPSDHLNRCHKDLISHHDHTNQLLAFYTSVASLQVSYSSSAPHREKPGETLPYEVGSSNGSRLFTCELDPMWRATQSERLEFIAIGFPDYGRDIALMLVENVNGICYRVNWYWTTRQEISIEDWMNQDPVQKLVILG